MKIADLFIKLGLKKEGFDKGIDDAKSKTNVFGSAIKKIGGIIAATFAAQSITKFAGEMAKLGGEAEGVRAAFNRIANENTLEDLRRATAGTVNELELMKRTVTASNLGLPVENLASLFQFAAKRAQETGESIDYLVNSIVTGIGRKSPLILDNLGISAIQLREKLRGVGMESASVADVARAVGEIAADSMERSGGIIDTNAVKIQRLGAIWQDFKLKLSESEIVINSIGDSLTKTEQLLFVWSSKNATNLEKWAIAFELFDGRAERLYNQVKARSDEAAAAAGRAQKEFLAIPISELEKMYDAAATAYVNAVKSGNKAAMADFSDQMNKVKSRISELTKNNDISVVTVTERIAILQEEIRKTSELISADQDYTVVIKAIDDVKSLRDELTKLQSISKATFQREDISIQPMTGQIGTPNMPTVSTLPPGLADMSGFIEKNNKYIDDMIAQSLENFNRFKENMAYLVEDFGIEVVEKFGEAMGTFFKTGKFPENFGSDVLRILGKFISNIGKMLITLGTASTAFQALIDSAFTNPVSAIAAIAAGAALVAIGGAISGAVAAGPKGSSTASAQGMTMTTTNAMDQQLVARVSGRDLEFVLAKRNAFTQRG